MGQPPVIIVGKGDADPGDQQGLVQNTELRPVVLHILQNGHLMGGNSVHIAAVQRGVLHAPVLQADDGPELRDIGDPVVEEQILRLSGGLHGDGLSGQIAHGVNIAARIHGDHLTADRVGPGPLVVMLPAAHGKAAPDAVDLAAVHQCFLLFPVDGGEHRLIPHPPEGLRSDLHIDAGGVAVIVQIDVGRVGIAADDDLGECGFRLLCAAAAEQPHGQQTGQKKCCDAFHVSRFPQFQSNSRSVSRRISVLMGLAIWPFIPTLKAFCRSSAKALAVMATMGIPAFSLSGRLRIASVA